jgi:hypothetical protein
MFLTVDVKNFQNLETLLTWKVLSSQLGNGKFISNLHWTICQWRSLEMQGEILNSYL